MSRRTALWILGPLSLALFLFLATINARLADAGHGIIAFEFAGTRENAEEMLADWGAEGRDDARLSLWLDYPFLIAYGAFFTLAVAATRDLARRRGWRRLARVGAVLVPFAALAAVCDAIENANLLLVLDGRGGDLTPLLAALFAAAKFVLLTTAQLYVLAGLVLRVSVGRRPSAAAAPSSGAPPRPPDG